MKRKILIAVSLLVFVTAVLVVVVEARRPKKEVLGLPALHIDPGTIYIDKDNDVTMTLSADKRLRDPMVQYRDAQGAWQKLGSLKDDGKSGDVKKKDKTYTLKVTIPAKGSVEYRATAKKGLRTLLVSPVTTLEMRRGDWVVHQPLGNTGITIDYPVGVVVTQHQDSPTISTFSVIDPSVSQAIGIDLALENPKHLSLTDWANANTWVLDGNWSDYFIETSINNHSFLLNRNGCGAITTFDDRILRIVVDSGFDACSPESANLLDKLVRSLGLTAS